MPSSTNEDNFPGVVTKLGEIIEVNIYKPCANVVVVYIEGTLIVTTRRGNIM